MNWRYKKPRTERACGGFKARRKVDPDSFLSSAMRPLRRLAVADASAGADEHNSLEAIKPATISRLVKSCFSGVGCAFFRSSQLQKSDNARGKRSLFCCLSSSNVNSLQRIGHNMFAAREKASMRLRHTHGMSRSADDARRHGTNVTKRTKRTLSEFLLPNGVSNELRQARYASELTRSILQIGRDRAA